MGGSTTRQLECDNTFTEASYVAHVVPQGHFIERRDQQEKAGSDQDQDSGDQPGGQLPDLVSADDSDWETDTEGSSASDGEDEEETEDVPELIVDGDNEEKGDSADESDLGSDDGREEEDLEDVPELGLSELVDAMKDMALDSDDLPGLADSDSEEEDAEPNDGASSSSE